MSLTIWYISKYFTLPKDRVGGRSFLLLREMAKDGHRPIVFGADFNHLVTRPATAERYRGEEIDGVRINWLRILRYKGAKSLGRVFSWLEFEWRLWRLPKGHLPPPDVVIVSSLSLLSVITGLWLARRHGCPMIFEVRDIWPLTIVEEGGFSPRNPLVAGLAVLERLAYRRADAIVGTMPNLVEHVREVCPDATAPVYCIPMGIERASADDVEALPADYAKQWIPEGKFIVCHAGTIGITNALETLLSCARDLRERDDIHFLIVGDGDLKEDYRRRCADLANVTFAPAVRKAQVQAVLERCDMLYFSVHPSKVWRFGQSLNKVIDYMLSGKPVIASYTGYPSMISEAGSGLFVPAGNSEALKSVIAEMAMRPEVELRAMGDRGREWLLRNRTYYQLAKDYISLLTNAIRARQYLVTAAFPSTEET